MKDNNLNEQLKNLKALLAVCEERADHWREEAKRLSGENERLAKRNALLVIEMETIPHGDVPMELEIEASDNSSLSWMTKECECCGRVVGLMVMNPKCESMIFEIMDRKILLDIAKFATSAAAWIGEHNDNKPAL